MNLMTSGVPMIVYYRRSRAVHALGEVAATHMSQCLAARSARLETATVTSSMRAGSALQREIAKLLALRNEHPTLRRGSQYRRNLKTALMISALPGAGQDGDFGAASSPNSLYARVLEEGRRSWWCWATETLPHRMLVDADCRELPPLRLPGEFYRPTQVRDEQRPAGR